MRALWEWCVVGYVRLVEPFIEWLVRIGVKPNTLTTLGTVSSCLAGLAFASGHIRTGGIILTVTAVFDLADGQVARRTNSSTVFGAFYDSTLDRVADGFLFGGLTFYFASSEAHRSLPMVAVGLLGIIGAFVTSYTRSRAESLGVEMKGVGMMERPERITLLAAPQALFGLALDGLVLRLILSLLSATALVTAAQRIAPVRAATQPRAGVPGPAHAVTADEAPVRDPSSPEAPLPSD